MTTGRRIAGAGNSSATIVSTGSSASSVTATNAGLNYTTGVRSTTNVFGTGSGLTVNIGSVGANGNITGITVSNPGTGYVSGDVVSIVNGSGETGRNAVITVTASDDIDTLYLTNVQGSIPTGDLVYYDTDTTTVSLANTDVLSSTDDGGIFSGNYLQNCSISIAGMYANNNKLTLSDITSDVAPSTLEAQLLSTTGASGIIEVEDSTPFETFEGHSVDTTNIGYVKIGDEIVGYSSATSNQLTISSRAVEGIAQNHDINDQIVKYEFNGISLRRINNVIYDISDTGIENDSYYIEIDRGATSSIEGKAIGLDRSTDGTYPKLSFATELIGGGNEIKASENIIFNRINPRFNILSPGKQTSVSANVRTTTEPVLVEVKFLFDLQNTVESVIPNQENELDSVRMVCSRVNELNQSTFTNVSGKRSFNSTLSFNTTDENLSPMVFLDDSTVEFISDAINRPVTNYATDSSTNSIDNDSHDAIYVSNVISLAQPASSLKVLLTAYRPDPADIRVLYSLVREDSVGIEQDFELFPGFNNLEATSEGSLKVVDASLNDGRPDVRVPASEKTNIWSMNLLQII